MIPLHNSLVLSDIPAVSHGFFGRQGGVSENEFATLNIGYDKGDPTENVDENRRRVCRALGSDTDCLMTVNQVHSNRVHVASGPKQVGEKIVADAIISVTPGLLIGVMAADCVPILLASTKGHLVAAIHSGWKGACGEIIQNTLSNIEELGIPREELVAAIGPCIWQSSYEVGEEFKTFFPNADAFFKPGNQEEKWYFDLPGYVETILRMEGVSKIDPSPMDTYSHPEDYFSFRRTTHLKESFYGNNLSAIMLRGIG